MNWRRGAAASLLACVVVASCVEPEQPFDSDVERVAVVDSQGERVGTIPADAIDEVAGTDERVAVLDDEGEQVGWWTADGFVPLDD